MTQTLAALFNPANHIGPGGSDRGKA